MKLVLIGYRGTGKSRVSQLLSTRMNMNRIGFDEEIVKAAGMSIPKIVEAHGWEWFRDLESSLTAKFSALDNVVLDTGGGVILRPANVELLKKNSVVIWLTAEVPTILARIGTDTNRPALVAGKTFIEEIEEVLTVRTPLYRAAADCEISTDILSPEEITDKIIAVLHFS
jgi:shikimate kinase